MSGIIGTKLIFYRDEMKWQNDQYNLQILYAWVEWRWSPRPCFLSSIPLTVWSLLHQDSQNSALISLLSHSSNHLSHSNANPMSRWPEDNTPAVAHESLPIFLSPQHFFFPCDMLLFYLLVCLSASPSEGRHSYLFCHYLIST